MYMLVIMYSSGGEYMLVISRYYIFIVRCVYVSYYVFVMHFIYVSYFLLLCIGRAVCIC